MWRSIRAQLAMDGEAARLMLGDVEAMQCATVLLDRLGTLAEMTPAAEDLFEVGGPLRLFGLSVHLARFDQDRRFQRLLAGLLDENAPSVAELSIEGGGPMPRRWKLVAARLPSREHGLGFEPWVAVTVRPARSDSAR